MTIETIITEKQFQNFAQERLAAGIADPTLFRERLKEVLDFAVVNEAHMDAGANAYYDRLLEGFCLTCERGLAGIVDSPDKRRMLRLIALTRGLNFRGKRVRMPAFNLTHATPPPRPDPRLNRLVQKTALASVFVCNVKNCLFWASPVFQPE